MPPWKSRTLPSGCRALQVNYDGPPDSQVRPRYPFSSKWLRVDDTEVAMMLPRSPLTQETKDFWAFLRKSFVSRAYVAFIDVGQFGRLTPFLQAHSCV